MASPMRRVNEMVSASIGNTLTNIKTWGSIVINVLDYGVKGDGVTDDYSALLNVASIVNDKGAGTIIFPPGTYYIGQYKTATNGILDIEFLNCDGLNIQGYGAVINVNGSFNRTSTSDATVIPFKFTNCNNISIQGFELNGNVDKMTRTPGLTEGTSYGMLFHSCIGIRIQDIYVHHFATDGIAFSSSTVTTNPRIACKDATLTNVRSEYNARQGMSVVQLRGGTFINSEFSYTGRATGSYGAHSPSAGVDIEPGRDINTPPPNQMDVNTGSLTFIGCKFRENVGATAVCALYNSIDTVSFIGSCEFDVGAGGGTGGGDGFILDVPGGLVDSCIMDMRQNRAYFGFAANTVSDLTLRRTVIRGYGNGLRSAVAVKLLVENCQFIGTHTSVATTAFTFVQNSECKFYDNSIFIPAVANNGGAQTIVQMVCKAARNNRYETDLVPTGTEYFRVAYPANNNPIVNEQYPNPTAFRPTATWNGLNAYSAGQSSLGNEIFLKTNDTAGNKISFGTAAPTSGDYFRGDIRFNSNASVGGVGWWECTTSGSPGTWTPHQIGVLTGIAAAPLGIGFLASSGGQMYIAMGTSSAADWRQIT